MNDQTAVSGVQVITFGCRLNTYESQVIRRESEAAGLGNETFVFNTCTVTQEAGRQARQSIRRIRRAHPHARIIVTGCGAQVEPEVFAHMPEVDHVLGNGEKMQRESYARLLIPDEAPKMQVNDIMTLKETASHFVDEVEGHARAFVQVQNGCDHRCTFCIIPFGRGPSRSVPMGAVVDEVTRLIDLGYHEVVLTGVDITSYGADLPGQPRLGQLVKALLKHVPQMKRLRLSSLDSIEVDVDLMAAFAEDDRMMPHVHLSLQHGDNLILKRMKRRHSREQAIDFCQTLRHIRPDMVFGADLIAGFPTEDEAMFGQSLDLVDACALTHLHVFPFSPRKGTPAARMPQVPVSVIKQRAQTLREKGAARFSAHLVRQVGRTGFVLAERGIARLDDFTPVKLNQAVDVGQMVRVCITGENGQHLIGQII